MLRISWLLVWILVLIQNVGVAQDRYYCRVPEMPTAWKTDGQPVKILRSQAVFSDLGTAGPSIDVRNTEAFSITNIAFVVEYLNREGNIVDTAVIAGAAPGLEQAMRTPFPIENTETWKGPIDPGDVARVQGLSDGSRTVTCPVSGHITFAIVRFSNGIVQRYASPGWQVPPLPRMVPRLDSACPPVQSGLIEVPGKLRISAAGDVTSVTANSTANTTAVAWAAAEVKKWKFHPALVDGQPVESELSVEFVLHASSEPDLTAISPKSPAVLIQFFPSSHDSAPRCIEAFAQLTEDATIP